MKLEIVWVFEVMGKTSSKSVFFFLKPCALYIVLITHRAAPYSHTSRGTARGKRPDALFTSLSQEVPLIFVKKKCSIDTFCSRGGISVNCSVSIDTSAAVRWQISAIEI